MNHLVSICIPTYNSLKGLERLLQSIFIQSYINYEIIISDDSTNTEIESYIRFLKINKQITYHHNTPSLGSPENWNKAISLANGEYIKIMHHDDWFTNENSLEQFVSLLNGSPNALLAFSGSCQFDLNSQTSYSRCITNEQVNQIKKDYRNLFVGNYIGAPSAVIFRKNSIDFDSRLIWLVDVEFYLTIFNKSDLLCFTTAPLVTIGVSSKQLTNYCTSNQPLIIYEYNYVYHKHKLFKSNFFKLFFFNFLYNNNSSIHYYYINHFILLFLFHKLKSGLYFLHSKLRKII